MEYDVLQIQQNVPFENEFTIMDDSYTPAIPLNLTGLTVFISVKYPNDYKLDDSAALITSKIIVHTAPLLGITTWTLTATETNIPLGKYKTDIRIYTNALDFINSDTFPIEIVPVVTRRLI